VTIKTFISGLLSLLCAAAVALPHAGSAAAAEASGLQQERITHGGLQISMDIVPSPGSQLIEGKDAAFRFSLRDAVSGLPLAGIKPIVWVDSRKPVTGSAKAPTCDEKIRAFLQGSLAYRPDVDLNTYYILALNEKATISVIDPLLGYYKSKLITTVNLKSPGEDWVMTANGRRIFVSMPLSNQVAVVDTSTWKVVSNVAAGIRPVRVALQPDERYLWVGTDDGSVVVIDVDRQQHLKTIRSGRGFHDIAFTEDSRYVFVTNRDSGTLSVIDAVRQEVIRELRAGSSPALVAYSQRAGAVYTISDSDGTVSVIDAKRHEAVASVSLKPGLRALKISPDGRWVFVANSKEDTLTIIDSSTNRVIHEAKVERQPDQIAFTKSFAFVRARGTDLVSLVPLDAIDKQGTLPVLQFTAGQAAPGQSPFTSVADAMSATPEGDVILVANPVDKMIYYYMQGMVSPMGSFQNYGSVPRAIRIVDRSLQQIEPGVFGTSLRLPKDGVYDVAFLLDKPRVSHCFTMTVQEDPSAAKSAKKLDIEIVETPAVFSVGEKAAIRFKVIEKATGAVSSSAQPVTVLWMQPGGLQGRIDALSEGNGRYAASFTVPQKGVYYLTFESPSLGIRAVDISPVVLATGDVKTGAPMPARKPRGSR
jgi:YVTN family beta-propeller protein